MDSRLIPIYPLPYLLEIWRDGQQLDPYIPLPYLLEIWRDGQQVDPYYIPLALFVYSQSLQHLCLLYIEMIEVTAHRTVILTPLQTTFWWNKGINLLSLWPYMLKVQLLLER